METTITSANSVFTLSVPGLYPSPVQLEGYAADRAWETEGVEIAETQMSVDGRLTAGYTPNPATQSIHLQADSPSKEIFNTIYRAMKSTRDVYYLSGSIVLPSTGECFTLSRGVLKNFKAVPDAAKVLQPMDFQIVWESIDPSLV